jgi:hypothetical protein
MKQTAVEWLAEQITTVKWKMSDVTDRNSIIEQAKAMEKEQIIRTHLMARCYDNKNSVTEAEQYYNETFKSE